MTKRIFSSVFIVATAVLLACILIIFGVMYEYFTNVRANQTRDLLSLATQGVNNEGAAFFNNLDAGDYRITWIAADGDVLADSKSDPAVMENHASREEVAEAIENGTGDSVRYSSTLSEKTIYHAEKLNDGSILRVSLTQYTALSVIIDMIQPILAVFIAASILSAVLARRLSYRIVEPLNSLNLDTPLENNSYDEIAPLLRRIDSQHKQINAQINELNEQKQAFSAITENMNEGLILLSPTGVIISINHAAATLFGADKDCVGKDMLNVSREIHICELIDRAKKGKHGECEIEMDGMVKQVEVNPVKSTERVSGIVLLIFDITERVFAEKQRREFSANVSHELKTPLQTIMGSAELIENNMVKSDDMPRFISRIRSEATRLVNLIDDIIRLSQLDENASASREKVDISQVVQEAVDALRVNAEKVGVSVSVNGEGEVYGVHRMLFEIAYNLIENAIKYNKPNGKVDVEILGNGEQTILKVCDNGIGIPKEHQQRVFGRFYRVDKSHSRSTGGTGLGLSIVKHAAAFHDARITLESNAGEGTSITVAFPAQKLGE